MEYNLEGIKKGVDEALCGKNVQRRARLGKETGTSLEGKENRLPPRTNSNQRPGKFPPRWVEKEEEEVTK